MSWDLFVFDLPPGLKNLDDLSPDYEPSGQLGTRAEIVEQILEIMPNADFGGDLSWGSVIGDDWSIEFNIGEEDRPTTIAFHVRGGDSVVGALGAILDHLGFRAYDVQAGDFFKPGPEAIASFHAGKGYRDYAISKGPI